MLGLGRAVATITGRSKDDPRTREYCAVFYDVVMGFASWLIYSTYPEHVLPYALGVFLASLFFVIYDLTKLTIASFLYTYTAGFCMFAVMAGLERPGLHLMPEVLVGFPPMCGIFAIRFQQRALEVRIMMQAFGVVTVIRLCEVEAIRLYKDMNPEKDFLLARWRGYDTQ